MNNITLGKYIPLNSVIHRMDPRAKICIMMTLLIMLFLPTGWLGFAILGAILLLGVILSRLSISFIWKSFKPMLFMLAFLLVVNIFVIKSGDVVLTIRGFEIHVDALTQTAYVVVRLLLMIVTTTMLTATTKPLDLTMALEDLMSPFAKIGLPAHDIAMMLSLALRFIPDLLEEAQRILKAQASRGVDMENGSLKEKINAILALIIPLFVSCFQKADNLADAMEARGYVVGAKRVRYKQLKMRLGDILTLILANALMAAMIFYTVWKK